MIKFIKNRLWLQIIIALILGVLFGVFISPEFGVFDTNVSKIISEWVAFPGNLFISVIKMIVIPIVFASIILGISSINLKTLKSVGLSLFLYFIITSVIAVLIGFTIVSLVEPGKYVTNFEYENVNLIEVNTPKLYEIPNMFLNMIPENIFDSVLNGEMLQIVIFALIIGVAIICIDRRHTNGLKTILESIQLICIKIVNFVMKIVPLAVFGLIAKHTANFGYSTIFSLLVYILCVVLGLLIMLLVYLIIVAYFAKINPITFLKNISEAQLLAFSTSSSAVTMPTTMRIAQEKLNVRSEVSHFVIPIGTTINMDGTAIYQTIATIFLAQVFQIELTITATIILLLTIIGASIGTPGTPGIGIVILSFILTSINVPLSGIALIIGVDRILDMLRTVINVTGDLTASVFINSRMKNRVESNIENCKTSL